MKVQKTWTEEQAESLGLDADAVARLHKAGYRRREDFQHVSAQDLVTDAGLVRPAAIALLVAAGALPKAGESRPSGPAGAVTVSFKAPGIAEQIDEALAELAGPGRVLAETRLRGLGVSRVARCEDGRPHRTATFDYLAHEAPSVRWWEFEGVEYEIVGLGELGAKRKHHPRTGEPLGRDPAGWYRKDRGALVVAAAVYLEGLDAGDPERTVLATVEAGSGYAAIAAQRVSRSPELRRRAEARIDGAEASDPEPARTGLAVGAPASSPSNPYLMLERLLISLYSAGEMRRFVRYLPGGEQLLGELPGESVSHAKLASEVVEVLRRHRSIDAALRDRLRAERPRFANEIDAVFDALGVR